MHSACAHRSRLSQLSKAEHMNGMMRVYIRGRLTLLVPCTLHEFRESWTLQLWLVRNIRVTGYWCEWEPLKTCTA